MDLPQLLHDIALQAERACRHQVDVGVEVDAAIGPLYTDGQKLRRALENLLLNAVKFTSRGSVHVTAKLVSGPADASAHGDLQPRSWERLLWLSVKDTGIGMDAAEIHKCLRGFHQAEEGKTRSYGGLGLGLATARRLVAVLGGEIRVRSELGRGSEFELLVPVTIGA